MESKYKDKVAADFGCGFGFNTVSIKNANLKYKNYSSKGEYRQIDIFISLVNKGGLNYEI